MATRGSAGVGVCRAVVARALQMLWVPQRPNIVGKGLNLDRIDLLVNGLLFREGEQRRPAVDHEAMRGTRVDIVQRPRSALPRRERFVCRFVVVTSQQAWLELVVATR